jgi:hypothetical protein
MLAYMGYDAQLTQLDRLLAAPPLGCDAVAQLHRRGIVNGSRPFTSFARWVSAGERIAHPEDEATFYLVLSAVRAYGRGADAVTRYVAELKAAERAEALEAQRRRRRRRASTWDSLDQAQQAPLFAFPEQSRAPLPV